jgi:hypothetical protein
MADKMEKSGINLIGFEKAQIDRLVNDPVMQAEIAKMVKLPGRKQSLSLGIPYMVTKGGKRYALTASEVGSPTIEKSQKMGADKKSFKDVYKTQYSSVREEQE